MAPKVSEVMTAIKSATTLEEQAVAAIKAMRMPTIEMLTAAAHAGQTHRQLGHIILAEYQAAIDAALE